MTIRNYFKDLLRTQTHSPCSLCPLQHVELGTVCLKFPKASQHVAKHSLFHEVCAYCDSADAGSLVVLCDLCRHLRIRHLLVCVPERHPDLCTDEEWGLPLLSFLIYPYREQSAQCDLCQFCVSIQDEWVDARTRAESKQRREHVFSVKQRGSAMVSFPGGEAQVAAELFGERLRRVRSFIDWEWLRCWLQDSSKNTPYMSRAFSMEQALVGVRVIDVDQDCVVSLPFKCDYVALSYVWGSIRESHLQCNTSNVDDLLQPGALTNSNLPQTISDAIRVCQQLRIRFLWVDSLCIVQNGSSEDVSQQLNQMANIFHQANLTLVAATGDSASHGLAGVSYTRSPRQYPLKLYKGFELVGSIPSLSECIQKSTWATRGWTYQEYVASKKLLFFTDYGLYLKGCFGTQNERCLAEGPAALDYLQEDELNLKIVEEFTKRSLTHSSDALRAAAGILEAVYEDGLCYGMPLAEFDSAILWMPTDFGRPRRPSTKGTAFPTWSWSSSTSSVVFPCHKKPPYGVGYWSRSVSGMITKLGSLSWPVIVPGTERHQSDWHLISRPLPCAALAWINGCVRSEIPQELHIDVGAHEYNARLMDRWESRSNPMTYWKDAFQSYDAKALFEEVDEESLSNPSCLMVHTQTASFPLDWRGQVSIDSILNSGCTPVIIRDSIGGIAGSIKLDDFVAHRLRTSSSTSARFIALSVDGGSVTLTEEIFLKPYIEEYFTHLSLSEFYGCPCTFQKQTATKPEHLLECPQHADFFILEPSRAERWVYFDKLENEEQELSINHYLSQVSYYDVNGKTLHAERLPPFLWVMMIAPSEDRGEERKVYQRLGIGQIFLKKWVDSSPTFKTIVLE